MNLRGTPASRLKAAEKALANLPSDAEARAAFALARTRDANECVLIYGGGPPLTRTMSYAEALADVAEEKAAFREVYGPDAGRLYR